MRLALCGASLAGFAADGPGGKRRGGQWRRATWTKAYHRATVKQTCEQTVVEDDPRPPAETSCCGPRPQQTAPGELNSEGKADPRARSLETVWNAAEEEREDDVDEEEAACHSSGPQASTSCRQRTEGQDCSTPLLSEDALGEIFDKLDRERQGRIGLAQIEEAIHMLNSDYDLSPSLRLCRLRLRKRRATGHRGARQPGLGVDNAQRLLCYLAGCRAKQVTYRQFVSGVQDIAGTLKRLRLRGFNLEQFKVVLLAAFKHFDADGNGRLSAEELAVAAQSMRVDLAQEDIQKLMRLLTGYDCEVHHEHFAPPLWEQWQLALGKALAQLGEKKGMAATGSVIERIRGALETPGGLLEKVQRCMATTLDSTEELLQSLELAVGANCVATAAQMLMQAGSGDDLGFPDLASLMIFVGLGATYTRKELEEVLPRDMTEQEALLFAQVFKVHGFSQAEFRSLLGCPSFQWQTVEPGSVLNPSGNTRLKLVVSGRSEVCRVGPEGLEASCELMPYFTIGEECLLRGRQSLWGRDVVRAAEPTILVSWDLEQLHEALEHSEGLTQKMHGLLVSSMTRNICSVNKLHAQGPRTTSSACCPSSECGRENEKECLQDCLRLFGNDLSLEDLEALLRQESFNAEDISAWAPHLSDKIRMGSADQDGGRFFTYLAAGGCCGTVSRHQCIKRMCTLGQLVASLDGITLREFRTVVSCSFSQIGSEGEGTALGLMELLAAVKALGLPIGEPQALALHAFFESGEEHSEEEVQPEVSKQLSDGVLALVEKLRSEADKRGVKGFGFCLGRIGKILDGPGDFGSKARRVQAAIWHGMDSLLDGTSFSIDLFSMSFSLWKLWGYSGCLEDCGGDGDVAMLLLSSGLFGLSMARRAQQEDQAPDLSVHEALLYALVCEREGVTVAEFGRLLQGGGAKWEHLSEGRLSHEAVHNSVRIIASGSCQVTFPVEANAVAANLGAGGIVGASHFLDAKRDPRDSFVKRAADHAKVLVTKPVTALTWDADALKAALATDPDLKAKFHRIVTGSMADALLDAKLCSA